MAATMATRPLIQIVFATCSFLAILFVGLLFDGAFAQAEYHLEARIQEGPPLPGLTELFMEFGALPTLLLSLPWFVLLGVPLVCPSSGTGYRSADSFVLRYLAFLSLELFAVFFVILAMVMPFIQHYAVMRSDLRKPGDAFPSVIVVLGVLAILVATIRALVRWRKRDDGPANGS
jgi:hypothetical protein